MSPTQPGRSRTQELVARLSKPDVEYIFRRFGLYIATVAFLIGLKWRGGYDLVPFLEAARSVAAGGDPYEATRAAGIAEWGVSQVFVSPPFVAHVLAPFSWLPDDVLLIAWSILGLLAVFAALRAVSRDTLAARVPRLVLCFVYVWASIFLGQVNLFVLAGLLLALGSRRDSLAGLGLALAIAMRATPAAFALVLLIEGRWRALAWTAAGMLAVVVIQPGHWLSFLEVGRLAATLPRLDVPVQMSVAGIGPLTWIVAVAVVGSLVGALVMPRDRTLLAGTAIGLGLVLLPSNAWVHWLAFALAPLMLYADRTTWSRWAILAFVAASFLPMGWPSTVVAVAVLVAMLVVSVREVVAARGARPADGAAILRLP